MTTSWHWLSANFKSTDFPEDRSKWTLDDDKIRLFEDRVKSWQLDIAECMLKINEIAGNPYHTIMKHNGFAVLAVVLSYFEMIGKYINGFTVRVENKRECQDSGKYFKLGLKKVFPHLADDEFDAYCTIFYEKARCGIYHVGKTGKGISLSGGIPALLPLVREHVRVNPHQLVPDIQKHFSKYIFDLKDMGNTRLRENFEKRFDYDYGIERKIDVPDLDRS